MPLAEAFVSTDDAVRLITLDVVPARDFAGIDVNSVDVIKLAKLCGLLIGVPFAEALRQIATVHEVSEDGPWIYRFPAELQSRLAALADADVESTADRWAQIEEFALDGVDAATVRTLLSGLSRLAHLAESSHRHVYLWNCL